MTYPGVKERNESSVAASGVMTAERTRHGRVESVNCNQASWQSQIATLLPKRPCADTRNPIQQTYDYCERQLHAALIEQDFLPRALPEAWSTRTGRGGRFRLRAQAWHTRSAEKHRSRAAETRTVRIEGPNCDILTCLSFPERNDLWPVFAVELVAFQGYPRVAFLDLQKPGLHKARHDVLSHLTKSVADEFPATSRDVAPDWASAQSSGHAVFSRDTELERLADWSRAFDGYLTAWRHLRSQAVSGELPQTISAEATQALADYRMDHIAHSPGTPFLKTIFGADWTDAFLKEFLYG